MFRLWPYLSVIAPFIYREFSRPVLGFRLLR